MHPALAPRTTAVPPDLVEPRGDVVPRRRPARIPVGPLEGFLLSRVDGRRTVADVAALVGLTLREAAHVFHRLRELRAIDLVHNSGSFDVEVAELHESDLLELDEPLDRTSDLPTYNE